MIVVGEFGCGKTTQIPQYLHQARYAKTGKKKIACVEPRRAAAICAAAAVSQGMGAELGHEVGYCIIHDDYTTKEIVLKYITDGMLVQEWLGRQDLLASYGVVMVDEAHERTLASDYSDVFALVKRVARARRDLKLVIVLSESGSTSDPEKLSDYFDKAPMLRIPHRQYRCS